MDIYELHERVAALPALENRLSSIRDGVWLAEKEVSRLLWQYEQERRDVENIEKESFSAFLLKLAGKYDDKLGKEQRDEISAKLAYDRAAARLAELNSEVKSLSQRISVLRTEEREYQNELNIRRAEMTRKLGGARYDGLIKEREAIISQETEIKEALSAASKAKATAERALESLKSAQGWATFDAFTRGGIISHMAKYSHIDDAESAFHALASQLKDFKTELSDVHGISLPGFSEITSTQRAIDFWFDNIFTDLSVRDQIMDNADRITDVLNKIDAAEAALNAKLNEKKVELDKNKRREEDLLLGR